MKIVPIVAVHDALLGYKNISCEQNTNVAVRGFTASLERLILEDGDLSIIDDLTLFYLGDFNLETGEITSITPKVLVKGNSVRANYEITMKGDLDDC